MSQAGGKFVAKHGKKARTTGSVSNDAGERFGLRQNVAKSKIVTRAECADAE